jgi:hypothetical protein
MLSGRSGQLSYVSHQPCAGGHSSPTFLRTWPTCLPAVMAAWLATSCARRARRPLSGNGRGRKCGAKRADEYTPAQRKRTQGTHRVTSNAFVTKTIAAVASAGPWHTHVIQRPRACSPTCRNNSTSTWQCQRWHELTSPGAPELYRFPLQRNSLLQGAFAKETSTRNDREIGVRTPEPECPPQKIANIHKYLVFRMQWGGRGRACK